MAVLGLRRREGWFDLPFSQHISVSPLWHVRVRMLRAQDILPCAGDITTSKNEHLIPGYTAPSALQQAQVEAGQVL